MSARRGFLSRFLDAPGGKLLALCVVALLFVVAFGPALWLDAAEKVSVVDGRQGASAAHWLGTDDLGRDVFARVMVATRLTMQLSLLAILIATVVGYGLGLLAALAPPLPRRGFQALLNLLLAFPPIVIALFAGALLGQGATSATVAVALAFSPLFARTMLNLAGSIAERDYVHAVRMLGVGPLGRLFRHILPNISAPLCIQTTVGLAEAMIALSALSFLGLGVQLPTYDWGNLLADNLDRMYTTPAVVLGPSLAITLVGVVFAFIGEAGARAMDPVRWTAAAASAAGIETAGLAAAASMSLATAAADGADGDILRVGELTIRFPGSAKPVVDGVSLRLVRGETLGIVGESGSGKSMTALAIAGLVPHPGRVDARELRFAGQDLTGRDAPAMRDRLGLSIAMVFQNPLSSLTPSMRIGDQLVEGVRRHHGMPAAEARRLAIEALRDVQLAAPERIMRRYPHELSGGMRQRVVIAMALVGGAELLIADEPTTALDVTIQRQILDLIARLKRERHLSTILISHDLGVVSEVCDRVLVMYRGKVVEELAGGSLADARHPYTLALWAAAPSFDEPSVPSAPRKVVAP
jgi:ABC-type dipeptide/oligopeptide/nickel transport system ATPase component/ABC-type dipeptide/oligopeptide/nickel transport system permease subunit